VKRQAGSAGDLLRRQRASLASDNVKPEGGAKTRPPGAASGWKYVNVCRLFVYIEHFIEEGANWAVFERNRALQEQLRRGAMTRRIDAPVSVKRHRVRIWVLHLERPTNDPGFEPAVRCSSDLVAGGSRGAVSDARRSDCRCGYGRDDP
jgi:hypothetical protein